MENNQFNLRPAIGANIYLTTEKSIDQVIKDNEGFIEHMKTKAMFLMENTELEEVVPHNYEITYSSDMWRATIQQSISEFTGSDGKTNVISKFYITVPTPHLYDVLEPGLADMDIVTGHTKNFLGGTIYHPEKDMRKRQLSNVMDGEGGVKSMTHSEVNLTQLANEIIIYFIKTLSAGSETPYKYHKLTVPFEQKHEEKVTK